MSDHVTETEVKNGGILLQPMGDEKKQSEISDSERLMLVEKERRVDPKTADKYRKITLIVSWITVVYLSIMGITVLVLAIINSSSTAFAFALDALLDCASSAVVIWRFSGSVATVYSAKREKIACVLLGSLFIVSFFTIMVRSAMGIASHEHTKPSDVLWILSLVNSIVCGALMVTKTILARALESISIATDAVNSGIGMIVALSAVLGDIIHDKNPNIWYLDSVIGIICSVFLLGYGTWVIIYQLHFVKTTDENVTDNH